MDSDVAEQNWDNVYETGIKYQDAPPLPFIQDIIKEVQSRNLQNGHGLYIGCGNGRNLVSLWDAGLHIEGLDISSVALEQLAQKRPQSRQLLIHGDFATVQLHKQFEYLISIQIFQHGNKERVTQLFHKVDDLLAPGGLFCLRAKSVNMPLKDPCNIVEKALDDSFTAHFMQGKKQGLDIHYFSKSEIDTLMASYQSVVPLTEEIERNDDDAIRRAHWQAIWQKV